MNSTDPDETLAALFDEVLMPLAEQLRAQGVAPFPRAPDVSWLSYYVRRKHSAMTAADFSVPACATSEELRLKLAAHWLALGRRELADRAAHFAAAAEAVRREADEHGAMPSPSPYVYAMF
jgi:hypothetical protein